jgi:hypothetical protein
MEYSREKMVEIIDEEGYFLGFINIIDLLVLLLVLAVIVAGSALVFGGTGQQTESATIEIRVENVQPYVADAIPDSGPINNGNVTSLENKSVTPATVYVPDQNGELQEQSHPRLKTVELEVTVPVTDTGDELQFDHQSLSVGNRIAIDLGTVELRGNVTRTEYTD